MAALFKTEWFKSMDLTLGSVILWPHKFKVEVRIAFSQTLRLSEYWNK